MSARTLALLAGLVVAAPAVYGGFVAGTIPTEQALTRVGVILAVALVAGSLLHNLLSGYASERSPGPTPVPASGRAGPSRRAGERDAAAAAPTTD